MYFSLEPKIRREDLYDREKELKELRKALEGGRIVLLTGIRRIGKTSLLRVFLEENKEHGTPFIFVDCRSFIKKGNMINKNEFNTYILNELKKTFKESTIKRIFDSISNIKIPWLEIGLKGEKKSEVTLTQALNDLNDLLDKSKKKLIIAMDEAQYLRFYGSGGTEMLNLLAHAYDHLANILFILTGSEVGVLHDFLKSDDPKAPLFGRYLNEIKLERFTKEESFNFLLEGFKQIKIKPNKEEIENAVRILDGLVGYLVIYGYTVKQKGNYNDAFEETIKIAEQLVNQELEELFLKSENYRLVLLAVAHKMATFSKIKEYISLYSGKISNQTLSNILKSLVKYSFLDVQFEDGTKKYVIPDPIIEKIILKL
ncbi:MAG: hypothetical protein AUJ99_00040 [Caldisericum sp. CG2_30_36_11]|nr:MAG: hypothetical protein AUJ99_00040 [Caldisericum sp. CG2_30_36_11]